MKLSSSINYGAIERMNKICGTTKATYSWISKLSDINDAMDWYCDLAFGADGQWILDGKDKSTPPIDTQNIVSGTNRYKISSFTEKIMEFIKLEILDSSGQGRELIPETIDNLSDSFQELYLDTSNTGTPTHYVKYGDFIYLRPFPNYSLASALKAYFKRPLTKFEFTSCVVEADDDTITSAGHGLSAGDTVIFEVDSAGTIPTGLTADTTYYVISSGLTSSVFKVSTTSVGSAVSISTDGSGVQWLKTSADLPIPEIHHPIIVRKASLNFLNSIRSQKIGSIFAEVQKDERTIQDFFGRRGHDVKKTMSPIYEDNR